MIDPSLNCDHYWQLCGFGMDMDHPEDTFSVFECIYCDFKQVDPMGEMPDYLVPLSWVLESGTYSYKPFPKDDQ